MTTLNQRHERIVTNLLPKLTKEKKNNLKSENILSSEEELNELKQVKWEFELNK